MHPMTHYRPLILLAMPLLLMLPACAPNAAPKSAPKAAPPPTTRPAVDLHSEYAKSTIHVTLDEFDQVRPGMTELQAIEIIGTDPTDRTSRFNPADEDGYTRPSATIILRWDNPDASWCELEFRNKKVDQKRHQDLKKAAEYNGTKFRLPIPPAPAPPR